MDGTATGEPAIAGVDEVPAEHVSTFVGVGMWAGEAANNLPAFQPSVEVQGRGISRLKWQFRCDVEWPFDTGTEQNDAVDLAGDPAVGAIGAFRVPVDGAEQAGGVLGGIDWWRLVHDSGFRWVVKVVSSVRLLSEGDCSIYRQGVNPADSQSDTISLETGSIDAVVVPGMPQPAIH